MPMIHVEMFAGRTEEQKRDLVRELTDTFVRTAGGTPESVQIVLTDVDKGNWASAGTLFSDKSKG